jgi:hypothetical protein
MGVLTDEAIEKLAAEIKPVDCLVPAGGIVAMRPLIVHASSKSVIETPMRPDFTAYIGFHRHISS